MAERPGMRASMVYIFSRRSKGITSSWANTIFLPSGFFRSSMDFFSFTAAQVRVLMASKQSVTANFIFTPTFFRIQRANLQESYLASVYFQLPRLVQRQQLLQGQVPLRPLLF